jgi:hypothetical protein
MNQHNSRSYPSLNSQNNMYRHTHDQENALKSPVHVYRNEAHVAPVVKTKPMPSYPGGPQNVYMAGSVDRMPEHLHNSQVSL